MSDCQFSFSHFRFWSGNFFLVAPFPDHCLLLPCYAVKAKQTGHIELNSSLVPYHHNANFQDLITKETNMFEIISQIDYDYTQRVKGPVYAHLRSGIYSNTFRSHYR